MQLFWVFLGGGLGSITRYMIGRILAQNGAFPWGTFAANAVACLLLGYLLGLELRSPMPSSWRLLLITGFCGGFSTFSTFAAEYYSLLRAGEITLFFVYIGSSLLTGLLCVFLGMRMQLP